MAAGKTRYDRIVVEDQHRTQAIGAFVHDVVDQVIYHDELAFGMPGIVFVRLHAHAAILAAELERALHLTVPAVTSTTIRAERDALLARMRIRDPSLPVVVASMVWSTGVDVPELEWVLWAGEGQAPIWLKQGAGRPTRLAKGKQGYLLFDWHTVGTGAAAYQEQAAKRMQHYQDGGFAVARPRAASPAATEPVAVQLLAQLFKQPSPQKQPVAQEPPLQQDVGERQPESTPTALWEFWSWGKRDGKEDAQAPDWAWKFAGRLTVYAICILALYQVIQGLRMACNM